MQKPHRVILVSALLCAFVAPLLSAQTYSPPKILFTGAPSYKPADLIALSGLTPGKSVTGPEIDKGMQQLADIGLFADVRYTIDSRALTFVLTPQPAANMLPAVFSNFILFPDDELSALVRRRVAVFNGKVPTSGNLQQMLQDALVAILLDKGIKAAVASAPSSPQPGAPFNAIVFSITQPPILIREVHVDSVSAIAQPSIAEALHSFALSPYDQYADSSVRQRLEDSYRDLGFLDIAVDPTTRGTPSIEPTRITVDLSTAIREGSRYRVSKIDWPVSPIVPSSEFEKSVLLKPGDPASRTLLAATTAAVQRQFYRRGYLDAAATLSEQKDSAAHTVAYAYSVSPGEIYHLKAFTSTGLTEQQKADFNAAWKLQAGAVFDEDYVSGFIRRNSAIRSLNGYSATYRIVADPNDHSVLLTMNFVKGGVLR